MNNDAKAFMAKDVQENATGNNKAVNANDHTNGEVYTENYKVFHVEDVVENSDNLYDEVEDSSVEAQKVDFNGQADRPDFAVIKTVLVQRKIAEDEGIAKQVAHEADVGKNTVTDVIVNNVYLAI